jgi:excisionase family DNA binding protein
MNKVLTLEDVAGLLNFSYRKAWEMATEGRLPAMQVGSAWRIDPVHLAAWLRDNSNPAQVKMQMSDLDTEKDSMAAVGELRRSLKPRTPRGPIGRTRGNSRHLRFLVSNAL